MSAYTELRRILRQVEALLDEAGVVAKDAPLLGDSTTGRVESIRYEVEKLHDDVGNPHR